MKHKRIKNLRGMTLIEVMVGLTVFTIAITGIVSIMCTMTNASLRYKLRDQEVDAQKQKIEQNIDQQTLTDTSGNAVVQKDGADNTYTFSFPTSSPLAGIFKNTDKNTTVYGYQAVMTPASAYAAGIDAKFLPQLTLRFFTNFSKTIPGDFVPGTPNPARKIIISNQTDRVATITVTCTNNGLVSYDSGVAATSIAAATSINLVIPRRSAMACGITPGTSGYQISLTDTATTGINFATTTYYDSNFTANILNLRLAASGTSFAFTIT
ncbi:MAG: prepilin-type N-terminal cleavage/methylation domain-containing protein [Oscillospiraceae bacterium]